MIASLYQSGSERSAWISGAVKCLASSKALPDLMKTEDGDGIAFRHQLLMLAGAGPGPAVSLQEIVEQVGLVRCQAEQRQRHLDHAILDMMRIEIDDDEYGIRPVVAALAVEQHLIILGGREAQIAQVMQRPVGAADGIHLGDEGLDAAWTVPVPDLELVFL